MAGGIQQKRPGDVRVFDVGPVEFGELGVLFENRGTPIPSLNNVRTIHHKAARLLAAGCSIVETSVATGISYNRLWILTRDPAFAELKAHYEEEERERWENVRERSAQLGMLAAEELQERILDQPEKIPTRELTRIFQTGLDYGGHKPADRSENLTAFTTLEQLRELKGEGDEKVSVREGSVGAEGGEGKRVFNESGELVSKEGDSVREESEEGTGSAESSVG